MSFFSDIYGKKMLSGQQEGWRGTNDLGYELTYILQTTGKLPALLALDFSSCTEQANRPDTQHRAATAAIDWYTKRNGVVAFCWHWFAPYGKPAFYTKDTDFDLSRGMTEGTPEHAALLRDLDAVAEELRLLRDAHVPVLWRPMHEVNGRWFWWGAAGPEPYKKLWRLMFDRYTYQHGLTNLIWVFSPGASTDLADWYPGDDCVDMIGQDHYPMDGNDGPAKDVFDELVALGRGTKMVSMTENGPIPDPDKVVTEKADWLFFTTWSGKMLTDKNSPEKIKKVFNHPHVMNLSDLPPLKSYPFKPAGKPVKLAFPAPPGDVAIGQTRRVPVTVAVQDRQGRTVRNGSYAVTLALQKNPAHGQLSGSRTAITVDGVATFSDLKFDKAGEGYTLVASAAGLRKATSPAFDVGPGRGVMHEWWAGWRGKSFAEVSNLAPAREHEALGKALEIPVFSVTNYASRIRGFIVPPVTGQYEFWVASAAISELWLGTNAAPAGKVKIAEVTNATPYRKWPHINESQSATVSMKAGQRYYLEVLQQQRAGSAQLAVRWRLPNGVEERPIPGWRLLPFEEELKPTQSAQARN